MSKFIRTKAYREVLNLDTIARFTRDPDSDRHYLAFDESDVLLGQVWHGDVEKLDVVAVIPDTTGTKIVEVLFDEDHEDAWWHRPVLAWEFRRGIPEPTPLSIDALSETDSNPWFFELPEAYGPNRWVDQMNTDFSSLEEAIAFFREKWEAS